MAVTYGNISTVSISNAVVSIPKPSGLSLGNTMVAHLGSNGTGALQTWSPPAGWSSLQNAYAASAPSGYSEQTFYKVATQADVDATTFDFSPSVGGGQQVGTIYYVVGASGVPAYVLGGVTANNTVTTTGLTPSANSLLVIIGSLGDGAATNTQASYAITTSNPSWTERQDTYYLSSTGVGHAVATATRPESTATGTSTVVSTPATATTDVYYQLLIAHAPTIAFTMTADVGRFSLTGNSANLTFNRPNILNIAKPTSTMINISKP